MLCKDCAKKDLPRCSKCHQEIKLSTTDKIGATILVISLVAFFVVLMVVATSSPIQGL